VRAGLGACLLAALAVRAAAAQQPDSLRSWELLVGHSYSSARALMQPATLTLEKVQGSPLYSVLDVGALVRGSLAARSWIEAGLRARAGSARPESQQVYGAMARVYREVDPVLVAVGGEYQADGGFDVHSLDATVELTPLGGLPGLGTWVSPAVHLRWRPWIGAAAGDGVRPYVRLSADWVQGRLEAGVEETAWLVSGSGQSFVKGDVSVQLVGGVFVTASGELGRSPPTWERTGRIGLGRGVRLAPSN
jgi:hypothetical protein